MLIELHAAELELGQRRRILRELKFQLASERHLLRRVRVEVEPARRANAVSCLCRLELGLRSGAPCSVQVEGADALSCVSAAIGRARRGLKRALREGDVRQVARRL